MLEKELIQLKGSFSELKIAEERQHIKVEELQGQLVKLHTGLTDS